MITQMVSRGLPVSKVRPVGLRGVFMSEYIPQNTELSWQKAWEDAEIFNVEFKQGNPKFYCLEMYPYPSGKMHMGCLLYTSPSPRDKRQSRMPSSA